MYIYITVNQKQTWGYLEGGSNSPVTSLSLWNSNLKAIPQTGSVVPLERNPRDFMVKPRLVPGTLTIVVRGWAFEGCERHGGFRHSATHRAVAFQMRATFHSFRQNLWEKLSIPKENRGEGEVSGTSSVGHADAVSDFWEIENRWQRRCFHTGSSPRS